MCGGENNLARVFLFWFSTVDGTQVLRLGSKHLYLQGHLPSSHFKNFNIIQINRCYFYGWLEFRILLLHSVSTEAKSTCCKLFDYTV